MCKNKRLIAFITSVCFFSIVSCSTGILSFADEENTISNENFSTIDSSNEYITSSQGSISIANINANSEDTMINLVVDSNSLDSNGVITEALTVDIPISITENPSFTEASMNLSIVSLEGLELDYTIESNNSLIFEKNGNSIVLSSNEAFIEDDILFIAHITIPENVVKNGDMFDIQLTEVELINENSKYIPNIPQNPYFVITDNASSDLVIIAKPIVDNAEEVTLDTTYTSILPESTTTTVDNFTSKDDSKTTITTTAEIQSTEPQPSVSQSSTSKTTVTTLISSNSQSGTTTTTTRITTTVAPQSSVSQSNTSKTTVTTLITSDSVNKTTTKISNSGTSISNSSKESLNTSKSENVSKENLKQESQPPKLGSRSVLGVIIASLVSISTAFATRKKS